jgi:hypothetical protein
MFPRRPILRIILGKSTSENNWSILDGSITNKDIIPSLTIADYVHSSCALRREIWDCRRCAKEDSSLLGCDALSIFNGYRRFKGDFCLHLDIRPSYSFFCVCVYRIVETAGFTETSVNFYEPTTIISHATRISFSALSCGATGRHVCIRKLKAI